MATRLYLIFETADELGHLVDEKDSRFYGLEVEALVAPEVGEAVEVHGETRYVMRRKWRFDPDRGYTLISVYVCASPPRTDSRSVVWPTNQEWAKRPPH